MIRGPTRNHAGPRWRRSRFQTAAYKTCPRQTPQSRFFSQIAVLVTGGSQFAWSESRFRSRFLGGPGEVCSDFSWWPLAMPASALPIPTTLRRQPETERVSALPVPAAPAAPNSLGVVPTAGSTGSTRVLPVLRSSTKSRRRPTHCRRYQRHLSPLSLGGRMQFYFQTANGDSAGAPAPSFCYLLNGFGHKDTVD